MLNKLFPNFTKLFRNSSWLDIVFFIQLLLVFLIAVGGIDRIWAWAIVLMLVAFIFLRSIEESVLLFSRSIPFYIALPVTQGFDSFNMWRIVVILIFSKWLYAVKTDVIIFLKTRVFPLELKKIWSENKMETLGFLLFIVSAISLVKAEFLSAGIKRLIYFTNLSLLFPVIIWAIKNQKIKLFEISKNITVSLLLILTVGYIQLASTYFLDINEFIMFWAGQIQLGFYGTNWSNIVLVANTWFSYNVGTFDYPKLRMFSTFPDSHTFPLFLLTGLPAMIMVYYDQIKKAGLRNTKWIKDKQISLRIAALFLAFLALVLSGTRGIWISIIFPLAFIFLFSRFDLIKRTAAHMELLRAAFSKLQKYLDFAQNKNTLAQETIKKINAAVMLFFVAFAASYIIASKPQFSIHIENSQSGERDEILTRVFSIVDASETSNNLRIEIWKKTLRSIAKEPLLGVGIGNFPVVLDQNISALKAGASAHNLYLNIFAETGIFSLLIFLAICALMLQFSREIFIYSSDEKTKVYAYATMLYSLWIFGYNLTDAAIFDEREFLIFILVLGIITGLRKKTDMEDKKCLHR